MGEKMQAGGEIAFPIFDPDTDQTYPGMTLREYASIELRVPNSWQDWLDEMIREALRSELAGQASGLPRDA